MPARICMSFRSFERARSAWISKSTATAAFRSIHYYAKFDKCIFSVYNIKCQDLPKAIFAGIFRPNFILLKAAFGGGKGYIDCEVHQSDT